MNKSEGRYAKPISELEGADFSMKEIVFDVTEQVIYTINRNAELYKDVKFGKMGARKHNEETVKKTCYDWAKAHNNEFGELFQTELDMVDWKEVIKRV